MNLDHNWISALASTVSAVAAVIAIAMAMLAQRTASAAQERAGELERKNAELAEIQSRLSHQSWADEYFREITDWAGQVSLAISRATHLVDVDDEQSRRDVLSILSASIDMGRWYFPNIYHDKEGQYKEPAYRGFRQPCLDWVVRAYDVFDGREPVDDKRVELICCQRNFVSCIQEVLDPRSREKAIERVLNDFSAVSALPKVQSPE